MKIDHPASCVGLWCHSQSSWINSRYSHLIFRFKKESTQSISSTWGFSSFCIVLAIPCPPSWSCTQLLPFPYAENIRQRSRRYGYPASLSHHSVASHTAKDSFISLDSVTIRKKRCWNGSYLLHLKKTMQIQVMRTRRFRIFQPCPLVGQELSRGKTSDFRQQSWGKVMRIQTKVRLWNFCISFFPPQFWGEPFG